MLDFTNNLEALVDPREAADVAGLRYVSDDSPGIRRRKAGKGFVYLQPNGTRLSQPETIRRLKSLAVPPWTEVWICPSADGHIQATGRDAKGRKQISLPSSTLNRSRGRQVRAHAGLRRRSADDQGESGRAYGATRPRTGKGARNSRASAGDYVDPRGKRRLCPAQRQLWAHHTEKSPRCGRWLPRFASNSPAKAESNTASAMTRPARPVCNRAGSGGASAPEEEAGVLHGPKWRPSGAPGSQPLPR